jgi:hypothetical protein
VLGLRQLSTDLSRAGKLRHRVSEQPVCDDGTVLRNPERAAGVHVRERVRRAG